MERSLERLGQTLLQGRGLSWPVFGKSISVLWTFLCAVPCPEFWEQGQREEETILVSPTSA